MTSIHVRMDDKTDKRFKEFVVATEGSFRSQSRVANRALNYYMDAMGWPKSEEEAP